MLTYFILQLRFNYVLCNVLGNLSMNTTTVNESFYVGHYDKSAVL